MATPPSLGVQTPVLSAAYFVRLLATIRLVRFAVPLCLVTTFLFLSAGAARAQFQQPLVFSSGGAVLLRNDQTGTLTSVPGSPFLNTGETLTLDVQGRYLFGIGANSIHMYAISDPNTGDYQEVLNSPFASPNTNAPIFIAVEPTGNYIAVVNGPLAPSTTGTVETFQIAPSAADGPALIPVSGSLMALDSTILGISQPASSAKAFYIYLGPLFPSNPAFPDGEELDTLSIDPQTGLLQGLPSQNMDNSTARCFAADPQGRYVVTGRGEFAGQINVIGIDGKFQGATAVLPTNTFPTQLWVDSTGTFVYATYNDTQTPTHIFSLNLQTNSLAETSSSPLPQNAILPTYQPDPTGPFNFDPQFNSTASFINTYTVDPQTGYFMLQNNGLQTPGAGVLTFSIVPGQQGVSGPSVQLSASSLSFGEILIHGDSPQQMVMLTSNGAEALSLNSISVTGTNAADFLEADTCQAPAVLQPGKFCSIGVTFAPSLSGAEFATLSITDNASGSPQLIQLSGTGQEATPPTPVATAGPNPLVFPTVTQGTTSAPMTVVIANTGAGELDISTFALGGNNISDFAGGTGNCPSAVLVHQASCSFTVTFAPLAAGQRTETITVANSSPGGPLVINVQGNANPAIMVAPAAGSSMTAAISAGATAQYQLQITPGANYSGSIALACTGVPLAATCKLPSTVQVSNGAVAMFAVAVTTTGAAADMAPRSAPNRWLPQSPLRIFVFSVAAMPWLALGFFRIARLAAEKRVFVQRTAAFGTALLLAVAILSFAGCGGGTASVAPPAQVVTPKGTSTITVTPSATNSNGQALQLPSIQLTLTVQ